MYVEFVRNHFRIELKDFELSILDKINQEVINDYVYIQYGEEIKNSESDEHLLIPEKKKVGNIEFKEESINSLEKNLDSLSKMGTKEFKMKIYDFKATLYSNEMIVIEEYYSLNYEERTYINGELDKKEFYLTVPEKKFT
jgi:hypothetical protein